MKALSERKPVSSAPLYLQVQEMLQEMIGGTEFSPGDKIPSERELSEQLDVSRMTVRRAIDNLVRMGLLERDSTSGTRVSLPKVGRLLDDRRSVGISQLLMAEGAQPGNKLLQFEIIRAPQKIAERLDLRLGSRVVVIRRLRLINETPFCLETSYLPAERVPGLAAQDLMANQSLYQLLRERYSIEHGSSDREIGLSYATINEAEALQLQLYDPVLLSRSLVFDQDGKPFEYVKSVNHPKFVVFRSREGGSSTALPGGDPL